MCLCFSIVILCVYVCECVCLCKRKRERKKEERMTETETENEIERQRERQAWTTIPWLITEREQNTHTRTEKTPQSRQTVNMQHFKQQGTPHWPWISGMLRWYWSGGEQKMAKERRFSIWARSSNSCSLLLNRLRDPVCVMDTRPEHTTQRSRKDDK